MTRTHTRTHTVYSRRLTDICINIRKLGKDHKISRGACDDERAYIKGYRHALMDVQDILLKAIEEETESIS
jgi:hypothetical protein